MKRLLSLLMLALIMLSTPAFATQYINTVNPNTNISIGNNNEVFVDNVNDRVGIGTAGPNAKLEVSGAITSGQAVAKFTTSGTGDYLRGIQLFDAGIAATNELVMQIGKDDSAYDTGQIYFHYAGDASTSNRISLGLHSADDVLNVLGTGNVGIGTTAPLSKLSINGGLHVGGDSDAGDNNILADGTITATGGNSGQWNTAYTHSTTDADTSATNEIQTLGTSGNTITLTSGGSVTAPYATNADTLDSVDATGFSRAFGTTTFSSSTTTAAFIADLTAKGLFGYPSASIKGSWSYAGNDDISDTGFGGFELAGTSIQTWADGSYKTVLAIRPTTGAGGGQVLIYNDQGAGYSPGWRQIWTDTTDGTGSGLDADLLDGSSSASFQAAGTYVTSVSGTSPIASSGGTTPAISITADGIGDTQLAYNTGQHLTTASNPTFAGLTANGAGNTYGTNILGMWTPDGNSLIRNWALSDGQLNYGGTYTYISDSPLGSRTVRNADGVYTPWRNSQFVPVDTSKTYKVSVWARTVSGNPYSYLSLTQAKYDLATPDNSGWGNPYFQAGVLSSSWTLYSITIGPSGSGAGNTWTSGTKYVQMGALMNYPYATYSGVEEITGFKIEEVTDTLAAGTTALGSLTVAGTFDPNGAITLPTSGISGAGTGSGLDADKLDGTEPGSLSVSYAANAGNADTVDTYHLNQDVLTTSNPTFNDVYSNSWLRNNNAQQGLYNTVTGRHFYSRDSSYWVMAAGAGMQLRDSHEGTIKGYLYYDGTGFGLLNNQGNWMLYSATNTQTVTFPGSTVVGGNVYSRGGYYYLGGSDYEALQGTDTWLRLNNAGSFTSGTYSPLGIRADGGLAAAGYTLTAGEVRATLFRDGDGSYYADPAGTSVLNQISGDTATRWGKSRIWTDRQAITADQNYWTGTNGWGLDATWDTAWKYGTGGVDIWGNISAHPQGVGYVHAQGIIAGEHYTSSDGATAYGWMMVGANNAIDNRYWLRGKWGGSTSGWVEMITTGNYNSYSPTLTGTGASGSWGISVTGSAGDVSCTNCLTDTEVASADYATTAGTAAEATNNYFYVRGTSPSTLYVDTDDAATRYVHHNGGNIGFLSSVGGWILRVNDASEVISGTYNGQTITSAASFTGTLSAATSLSSTDIYASSWFRNDGADEGLYNSATATHFYAGDASYWVMGSANGLQLRNTHEGTITGYLYWDGTAGSNNFGLLSPDGSWGLKLTNSDSTIYHPLDVGGVGLSDRLFEVFTTGNSGDGLTIGQDADNSQSIQAYIDSQWSNRVSYAGGCCNLLKIQPDVGSVQIGSATNPTTGLYVYGTTTTSGQFSGPGTGLTGTAASLTAGAVPWSGITSVPSTVYTSAARPGPTRLYRSDDNSDYSLQTNWNTPWAGYWGLRGYSGGAFHAEVAVGYAANAGSATTATNLNGGTVTAVGTNSFTFSHGQYNVLMMPSANNGAGNGDAGFYQWVSEPGASWTGAGIGRNMRNDAIGFNRINAALSSQMMRFDEGTSIIFTTEDTSGTRKTPLTVNPSTTSITATNVIVTVG